MTTRTAEVFEVLSQDHRQVLQILSRMSETASRDTTLRESLTLDLERELEIHSCIEELAAYPEAQQSVSLQEMAQDFESDHKWFFSQLDRLETLWPGEPAWEGVVKELKERFEAHVLQEEGVLFPRLEAELGIQELKKVNQRLLAARQLAA